MIACIAAYLAVGVALFPLGRADRWTLLLAIGLMERRYRMAAPELRPWLTVVRDNYRDRLREFDDLPDPIFWVVVWPIAGGMIVWSVVQMLIAELRVGGR